MATVVLLVTAVWWAVELVRHRRSKNNSWRTTVLVGVGFSRIAAGFLAQAGTWPVGDARNGPEFAAFCWVVVLLVGPALAARGFWQGWHWRNGKPVAVDGRQHASGSLTDRLARVFWLAPDIRPLPPLVTYSEIEASAAAPLPGESVLWTGNARPISVVFWRLWPFAPGAMLITPVIAAQSDFSAGWPRHPEYFILAALIFVIPTAVYCARAARGPWAIRYMVTDGRVVAVRPIGFVDYEFHACECRLVDLPPARARVLPFGRGSVCFGSQWMPRYRGDGVFEGLVPVRPLVFLAIPDPRHVAELVNEARSARAG